jgi:hypothetical protein
VLDGLSLTNNNIEWWMSLHQNRIEERQAVIDKEVQFFRSIYGAA